jgi:hypothetical protein
MSRFDAGDHSALHTRDQLNRPDMTTILRDSNAIAYPTIVSQYNDIEPEDSGLLECQSKSHGRPSWVQNKRVGVCSTGRDCHASITAYRRACDRIDDGYRDTGDADHLTR